MTFSWQRRHTFFALASWSRCGSPSRAARELSLPRSFSSDNTRATSDGDSARKVIRFGYGVPSVYFTITRVSEAKHRRNTVWRYCIVRSRGIVDLLSTPARCELCGIYFFLFAFKKCTNISLLYFERSHHIRFVVLQTKRNMTHSCLHALTNEQPNIPGKSARTPLK